MTNRKLSIEECAIKFKIPGWKLEAMAKNPLVGYSPGGDELYHDIVLHHVRKNLLKRNFDAVYFLTIAKLFLEGKFDMIKEIESFAPVRLKNSTGQDRDQIFKNLRIETIEQSKLPEAERLCLNFLNGSNEPIKDFRSWAEKVIADQSVNYYFLAVRLLASFPYDRWPEVNITVSKTINLLFSGKKSPLKELVQGKGPSRIFSLPKTDLNL